MTARSFRAVDRQELARLEEGRRTTQRQLDLVERRIATAVRRRRCRAVERGGGKPPDGRAIRRCHHEMLDVLTAERQPETDALAHRLQRQDRAIQSLRERQGIARPAGLSVVLPLRFSHPSPKENDHAGLHR